MSRTRGSYCHISHSLAWSHPSCRNAIIFNDAYQIPHVHRSLVGVHIQSILSRLEIIIHVHYFADGRNFVPEQLHIADVFENRVLFAGRAITIAKILSVVSRDSTVGTPGKLSTLADWFLLSASPCRFWNTTYFENVFCNLCRRFGLVKIRMVDSPCSRYTSVPKCVYYPYDNRYCNLCIGIVLPLHRWDFITW
jgi:hypothetical protein